MFRQLTSNLCFAKCTEEGEFDLYCRANHTCILRVYAGRSSLSPQAYCKHIDRASILGGLWEPLTFGLLSFSWCESLQMILHKCDHLLYSV